MKQWNTDHFILWPNCFINNNTRPPQLHGGISEGRNTSSVISPKIFNSEKNTNPPIMTEQLFQEIRTYVVTIPDIDDELTFAEIE